MPLAGRLWMKLLNVSPPSEPSRCGLMMSWSKYFFCAFWMPMSTCSSVPKTTMIIAKTRQVMTSFKELKKRRMACII